jgi:hypothetical protein
VQGNAHMHIVGEITDDETATLAALPDPDRYDPAQPPDFVNANAVTARVIAQVRRYTHSLSRVRVRVRVRETTPRSLRTSSTPTPSRRA